MTTIKKGDRIHIDGTVAVVLCEMGFNPVIAQSISNRWACCNTVAKDVWKNDKHEFVTVDLCVEIPIQCCSLV